MSPTIVLNDLARGIERDHAVLLEAFERVLTSARLVLGPAHEEFQSALALYLAIPHVIGVASGTDALELAMKAVAVDGRRTVLTAANAGGYSSIAARRAGLPVAYADVDPQTLCLSHDTVEAALTDDIGTVVVTHLYGNLTDVEAIVDLCRARDIRLIEDCAQAIGARRQGRHAGSFGDVAALSFYPTKNLGALGDGGAVLTGDPEIADRVHRLRQYGWDGKYRVAVAGGVNSRLDDLQAAFLLARLPLLDGLNARRRWIIGRYVEAAAGTALNVMPADGDHHAAHLAVARSGQRDELREAFAASGVQTDVHFPVPDHRQPGFTTDPVSLPVTESAAEQVLSLPLFPEMTDDEVEVVCDVVSGVA